MSLASANRRNDKVRIEREHTTTQPANTEGAGNRTTTYETVGTHFCAIRQTPGSEATVDQINMGTTQLTIEFEYNSETVGIRTSDRLIVLTRENQLVHVSSEPIDPDGMRKRIIIRGSTGRRNE